MNILQNIYSEATSVPGLHKDSEKFKLGRGARQGDNIPPKLYTSCLQHAIINKINWENKGVRIDGEYLSHLNFADDIVLIANSTSKLQGMFQDIHDISKPVDASGEDKNNVQQACRWKEDQGGRYIHLSWADGD